MKPKPKFFRSPAELRVWFARYAATAQELHLGYYKIKTGKPSVTWPESVDEALCVGWIDGIRHRIDEESYRIRFTPRRPRSHWSDVNLKRVEVLIQEGRMTQPGLEAYQRRSEANSRRASYEQADEPALAAEQMKILKADRKKWRFFQSLPPGYRKRAVFWVTAARKPETRDRRFAKLLESLGREERIF